MSARPPQSGRTSRGGLSKHYKVVARQLNEAVRRWTAPVRIEPLEGRLLLSNGTSIKPPLNIVAASDSGETLVVTSQPPNSVTAGQSFGFVVTTQNGDGSTDASFNGNITVSDQYGQRVYGTTTVQAVSGVATFSGLSEKTAVNGDELEARSTGLPVAYSNSFDITAAVATHLVVPAPAGVLVNGTFSLTVVAEDQYGNVDPTFNGNVTLALSANPANAALGGILMVQAVNGLASFTNLTINKFSSGYTLRATTTGLPSVTTAAFAVTDQLVVTTQPPANITAGSAFGIVVAAEDGLGHADPSFHGTVTAANVPGSTLAGVLSVQAVNGVATFTSLAEDQATASTYLTVSALGLATTQTNTIDVTAATATHLAAAAPSATLVNGAFSVTVYAQDPFGNTDSSFRGNVTLALATNPTGAALGGTLTVPAAGGVATFSGLTINKLGTGYTLKATAGTLRSVTTAPFNMTDQLVVTTQPPASIVAGATFGLVVTAEDGDGRIDTAFDANVSVKDNYGYEVYGVTTVQAVNGVASFSGLAEHIAINGDELQAASSGLPTTLTGLFNITGTSATHLAVAAPLNVVINGAFNLTVDAEDQFGNVDPTFNGSVTLTLSTNPGNATLGGTLTVQAINGVATFTGLTINRLASGYTLEATTPGLSTGATLQFNVSDQLVVTTQPPATLPVGEQFGLVVDVEDGDGVVDTSFDSTVSVRDYYGHHVYGTTTVQAVDGVASFSGLSENVAFTGDALEITSAGLPAAYSASFNDVGRPATQLAISAPSSVVVNGAFDVTVDAVDQFGNVDPTFNGTATLAFSANPGNAVLGGILTAQAFNGVATFSGLTISLPASGYMLMASTPALGSVQTGPINAAYQLAVITQPPSNLTVDTPFGLAVAVEDGDGAVQTSFNGSVTVSNASGNKLYGVTTVQVVNGVASFSGLAEGAAINGDELEVSSGGLPNASTSQITVAALTATQLSVSAPSGVLTNGSFSVTVNAVDASGVVDSTFNGDVTLTLSGNPTNAALGGTLTVQAFNGVATFTGLTINKLGSGYALKATAIGLTTAITGTFSVADVLVVTTQPPSIVSAGVAFGVAVTADDGLGHVDTSFNGTVTLADGIGNALTGTVSISAVNGVAHFTGLTTTILGAGDTLQATATGLTSATTAAFNVVDLLVVTTQPPNTVAAGAPFGLIVTAEDGPGNIDTSFQGTVTVADNDGNTLAGKLSVAAVNGMVNFSGLSEANVINGDSLAVTSSGLVTLPSSSFNVVAPTHQIPPTGVIFFVAPSGGAAGSAINPAIVVHVVDTNNDVVTTDESEVTLTLETGPAGAPIGETFMATAVNGVATFGNVAFNIAGNSYTLQASDELLTTATSADFTVTPAAADKLVFNQQPTAVTAGTAISPSITVDVEDQFDNVVTSDNSTVALAVSTPAAETLSGTDSMQASAGVATFANVVLDTAGTYTLAATDGLLPAITSGSFTVSPAEAHKLVFTQQPVNSPMGGSISPAITVTVEDQFGNVVTSDNSKVTLALSKSPAGASLGGTLSVHAVSGVATFSGISPTKAGAYALGAADGSLAGATSDDFSVGQLAITQQPANVTAGASISIVVDVEKPSGKVIAADDSQASISITKGPAGAVLTGTTTVTAVKGVATFNNLSLSKAGAYTLTITDGGSTVKTVKFTVSAAAAADLAFVQNLMPVTAGLAITPDISVSLTDSFGNPITGLKVKLAIATGPAGGTLSGKLNVVTQNGVATFSGISLTQAGGYTLKATHGLLTATSSALTVNPAAAAKVVFVQQPTGAAVGAHITPAIAVDVEDTFGNVVTTDDSNVTLLIKPNSGPAGAILDGTLTVTAQNGVAMFSDISLSEAGTYRLKAKDGSLATAKSAAFIVLSAA